MFLSKAILIFLTRLCFPIKDKYGIVELSFESLFLAVVNVMFCHIKMDEIFNVRNEFRVILIGYFAFANHVELNYRLDLQELNLCVTIE